MRRFAPGRVLRDGPLSIVEGRFDGVPALCKRTDPVVPWLDPRSAFFGGAGLAPPGRPPTLHEAEAWRAVEPEVLLDAGHDDIHTWVVLRRLPGRPLVSDARAPRRLLVDLLREAARLHAADVLHRDVRPANVLAHDGGFRLVDLDVARVAGLGPVGRMGSRAFAAPETLAGEGDVRSDLFAIGAVVRWYARDVPPVDLAHLIDALTSERPADRPATAADALASLGVEAPPPAAPSPPHPSLAHWWATRWADLALTGDPFDVVRLVDREGTERDGVAAVASRLLASAPRRGRDAWLALGALCRWLAEATRGEPAERYLAQADEARARARADWHPAARALRTLAAPSSPVEATFARCALGMPRTAFERARAARHPSATALAAWHTGDPALVDRALRHARPPDATAVQVAASRLLALDPVRTPLAYARHALPETVLDAVHHLASLGRADRAAALANAVEEPLAGRARLALHLRAGRVADASRDAVVLARAGAWDPTVAAMVLLAPEAEGPLRDEAEAIVLGSVDAARPSTVPLVAAAGQAPESPALWGLALTDLAARAPDLAGEALGRLDERAGPSPWGVLSAVLLLGGYPTDAVAIARAGLERFPDSGALHVVAACAALAAGLPDATEAVAEARATAPDLREGWLLAALAEAARGNAAAARSQLGTARALGASPALLRVVDAAIRAALAG